jgi:DNA-binding transcriptional MerR regulator
MLHGMQDQKNDLVTTSTVAKLLGLSEGGVRNLANRGDLPVALRTSTDGTRLFSRAAVERFAAKRDERRSQPRG